MGSEAKEVALVDWWIHFTDKSFQHHGCDLQPLDCSIARCCVNNGPFARLPYLDVQGDVGVSTRCVASLVLSLSLSRHRFLSSDGAEDNTFTARDGKRYERRSSITAWRASWRARSIAACSDAVFTRCIHVSRTISQIHVFHERCFEVN